MTEEMIQCDCGLIVASSKMQMHMEGEHMVKIISDIAEATRK
jgi:hypothetical protein